MKLTDRILQAYLQDHFSILRTVNMGTVMELSGPLGYSMGDPMESGWVYVLNRCSDLPEVWKIPSQVMIICRCGEDEHLPESICGIEVPEKVGMVELLNTLIHCYQHYENWTMELEKIRERLGTIEEMLRESFEIFGNPMYFLGADFSVVSRFEPENMELDMPILNNEAKRMDMLNSLLQDAAHAERRMQTSAFWGPEYLLGEKTLNWNLFQGNEVTHILAVVEYKRPLEDYHKDLLEILGRYLTRIVAGREVQERRQNQSLEKILVRVLADRTLDYMEASRQLTSLGWASEQEYMCLVLQLTYLDQYSISINSICNYVEDTLGSCCSFLYEDEIVCFFNVSRIGKNEDDIASLLTPFIRDTYLKAGYSRVMEGHMNLRRQYVQARLALDVGSRKNPYLWIHHFDGVAMTYIMEQVTRKLPGYMLCHRGILTLRKMDEENGSDYIRTLRTFLDQHQNVVHSANELFIHRSTLLYRLEKIKEVLESELDDPEELLYLDLSLRLLNLQESYES